MKKDIRNVKVFTHRLWYQHVPLKLLQNSRMVKLRIKGSDLDFQAVFPPLPSKSSHFFNFYFNTQVYLQVFYNLKV